jgi:hypothetical protein
VESTLMRAAILAIGEVPDHTGAESALTLVPIQYRPKKSARSRA